MLDICHRQGKEQLNESPQETSLYRQPSQFKWMAKFPDVGDHSMTSTQIHKYFNGLNPERFGNLISCAKQFI